LRYTYKAARSFRLEEFEESHDTDDGAHCDEEQKVSDHDGAA
jgi:hypothetical protein